MKIAYDVFEIDANEKQTMIASELSRQEARAKIERLQKAYGSFGLRYTMKREPNNSEA